MKSAKRQREKGASDTEESERTGAKKSKTQVGLHAQSTRTPRLHYTMRIHSLSTEVLLPPLNYENTLTLYRGAFTSTTL